MSGPSPIAPAEAGTAGFAGAPRRLPAQAVAVSSFAEFAALHGPGPTMLSRMVRGFFDNGGRRAFVAGAIGALEAVDGIGLLCPRPQDTAEAIAHCERRGDRIALVSLPPGLRTAGDALAAKPAQPSSYAAVHHPWVRAGGEPTPPGGHVAGLYASVAPARAPTQTAIAGLDDPPLETVLSPDDVALLADGGVNPLRLIGTAVRLWGARTLSDDPEWRYVPVRRYALYVEASLQAGLQWVVFEPNGEALWASVRQTAGDFLLNEWRSGALQGTKPEEAFFVRCDRTTMTQNDLDNGRLVCLVGVAVVKPAEFVILRICSLTASA